MLHLGEFVLATVVVSFIFRDYYREARLRGGGLPTTLSTWKLVSAAVAVGTCIYMLGMHPSTAILRNGFKVEHHEKHKRNLEHSSEQSGAMQGQLTDEDDQAAPSDPSGDRARAQGESEEIGDAELTLSMLWPPGYCHGLRMPSGHRCRRDAQRKEWVVGRFFAPAMQGPRKSDTRQQDAGSTELELESLKEELKLFWPNLYEDVVEGEHWADAWERDGMEMVARGLFQSTADFFTQVLEIHRGVTDKFNQLKLSTTLVPGKHYFIYDFEELLREAFDGVPSVSCRTDTAVPVIDRVDFCFTTDGFLVDCPYSESECGADLALFPTLEG